MSVAVVTGANRGIGLGWTEKLLADGYEVVATHRANVGGLEALSEQYPGKLRLHQLDVTDDASIRAFAETVERVNLVICNAGIKGFSSGMQFEEVPDARWEEAVAVNQHAPRRLAQAFFGKLSTTENAMFVYMSSGLSSTMHNASGEKDPYRSTKAAGNAITWGLSQRLMCKWEEDHPEQLSKAPCAMAICPGWVKTEMGGDNARLTVDESVNEMWNIVQHVRSKKCSNGLFMHGTLMPYERYDQPDVLKRVLAAIAGQDDLITQE